MSDRGGIFGLVGGLFPATAAKGLTRRRVFREVHPEVAGRRVDLTNSVLLRRGIDPVALTFFTELVGTHGALGLSECQGGEGQGGEGENQGDGDLLHDVVSFFAGVVICPTTAVGKIIFLMSNELINKFSIFKQSCQAHAG